MAVPDFWNAKDLTSMARSMRLAVVQNQRDIGNLTNAEARELLAGPLTPKDESTRYDDSEWLDQYDPENPDWHPLEWVVVPELRGGE